MKTVSILKRGSFLLVVFVLLMSCKKQESNTAEPEIVAQETNKPQTTHTVEIKDMMFQPAELHVHAGDTVVWINKDIVAHDVTQDDEVWASPPLAGEASWKKIITTSDSYYCSIHVVMKGKVIVD